MQNSKKNKPLGFKVRNTITGLYLTGGGSIPGKHFNKIGKTWPSIGHMLMALTYKKFNQKEEEDKLNWEIVPLIEGEAYTAAFFLDKLLKK